MPLAADYLSLESLWFLLIGILWIAYFVLEGFDFGVCMLYPALGRNDPERRALLGTILPVWEGYEVWLLVAGGATFAAFPGWYASLFSGFYLALFLILVALIVRGVGIEYRNKHAGERWQRAWDRALPVTSVAAAFLWGVAFANIVRGVPIDGDGNVRASLLDLLNPYALLGGLTTLLVFALHGALYLTLRTRGELVERARRAALLLWPGAATALAGFLAWTAADAGTGTAEDVAVVALAALTLALGAAAGGLARARRLGAAFVATAAAVGVLVALLLVWLYPRVLVSSMDPAASPTVFSTASSHYTLVAMTIVAAIFVPLVVGYQLWALRIFRERLGPEEPTAAAPPKA